MLHEKRLFQVFWNVTPCRKSTDVSGTSLGSSSWTPFLGIVGSEDEGTTSFETSATVTRRHIPEDLNRQTASNMAVIKSVPTYICSPQHRTIPRLSVLSSFLLALTAHSSSLRPATDRLTEVCPSSCYERTVILQITSRDLPSTSFFIEFVIH